MSKIFTPDCWDCKWCIVYRKNERTGLDKCSNASVSSDYSDTARKYSHQCGMKGKFFAPIKEPSTKITRIQKFIAWLFSIPINEQATATFNFNNVQHELGGWQDMSDAAGENNDKQQTT